MTNPSSSFPRRDFLGRAWVGLGLLAAAGTGYIGVRFLTSQTGEGEFGTVVTAGLIDDFPLNTVTAFPNGKFYLVRRDDGGFLALYHKCTHLACVVLWHEAEGEFYCPCHGLRFQPDGTVLNRPATRSLTRFPVTFDNNAVLVATGNPLERERLEAGDIAYPGEGEAAP